MVRYDNEISKQINIPNDNFQKKNDERLDQKDTYMYEFDNNTKFRKTNIKRMNYKLNPTNEQIKMLDDWIDEIKVLYDLYIGIYNDDAIIFNGSTNDIIKIILDSYCTEYHISIPIDLLRNEIRMLCSMTRSKEHFMKINTRLKPFDLGIRKNLKYEMLISTHMISKDGIYVKQLGNISGFECKNINGVKEYIFSAQFKINE